MQQKDLINKNLVLYRRRKHKLWRVLALGADRESECMGVQNSLVALYEVIANKENKISRIGYFLKYEFFCDLGGYTSTLIQMMGVLLKIRGGGVIAFVLYRLSRKYPSIFYDIFQLTMKNLISFQGRLEQIVLYLDLYLYGFPFTVQDFVSKIFPKMKNYVVQLIPRYRQILGSGLYFSLKLQRDFNTELCVWLGEQRQKIQVKLLGLVGRGEGIQRGMIEGQEWQQQMMGYEMQLQMYETEVYHFGVAMCCMGMQFDRSRYRLKTVFELRKQCQTFNHRFELSSYEKGLYESRIRESIGGLRPVRKGEILKLQQNDAFIDQVRLCGDVVGCLNLAGYFLQRMNVQSNREYLIETIIDGCFGYNNIEYILKIVFEIGQLEPSIGEYCAGKARKMCGGYRMNGKYQRLICEMARYRLIDEGILLGYCERILRNENSQVTRQVEFILENLGAMVYYRSLGTHVRINALFQRIEGIIKGKLMHFNIEHLYQLKGLINYLRNHTNSANNAQSQEIAKIEIKDKDNYGFILKKMQKLIKEGLKDKVIDYMICGIDHQEYLTSYYYASLLKDLNNGELQTQIHKKTMDIILSNVREINNQKAVRWSRFLGQLFNYEVITRKELFQDLLFILRENNQQDIIAGGLKCVCSALQTSKTYLNSRNARRQKENILMLLELKIYFLKNREWLEYCLVCEIQDLYDYFNPSLLKVLNSEEDILKFIDVSKEFCQNEGQTYSYYIGQLAEGVSIDKLRAVQDRSNDSRRKYREKDAIQPLSEPKRVGKARYVQKNEPQKDKQPLAQKYEEKSRTSEKTLQTIESVVVKKIKVIGRSKRDNKIKTVTCSYSQSQIQK